MKWFISVQGEARHACFLQAHHLSLYTQHYSAQPSSPNVWAWIVVPTRAQCGLRTSHIALNYFVVPVPATFSFTVKLVVSLISHMNFGKLRGLSEGEFTIFCFKSLMTHSQATTVFFTPIILPYMNVCILILINYLLRLYSHIQHRNNCLGDLTASFFWTALCMSVVRF